jgi:hypothetical protein
LPRLSRSLGGRRTSRKAAPLRQGSGIARSVQYTDNHDLRVPNHVVDRVIAVKRYSQAPAQLFAARPGERKFLHLRECRCDRGEQPRRCRLASFERDIGPDFRKIGFRRISQT